MSFASPKPSLREAAASGDAAIHDTRSVTLKNSFAVYLDRHGI